MDDVLCCIRHLFTSWEERDEGKKHWIFNSSQPLERMHQWSELPGDICSLIDSHLTFPPHSHKFAAVCKNWYRVAKKSKTYGLHKQIPMLLLPYNEQTQTCTFVQLGDFSTYELELPILNNSWICGAFKGWLAMNSWVMGFVIFNPFLKAQIPLPRLNYVRLLDWHPYHMVQFSCEHYTMVTKVILSDADEPSFGPNCMVAIICNDASRLAVARMFGEDWTVVLDTSFDDVPTDPIHDIIFRDGKLCAVSDDFIAIIDCCNSSGFTSRFIATPEEGSAVKPETAYLVSSLGNLLLVQRFVKRGRRHNYKTYNFLVFRLERETETWTRLYDLGGQSLFIGSNCSTSVSADLFSWCKPNCIYFTNNRHSYLYGVYQWEWDNGIFNMDDASFETFDHIQHSLSQWPSPAIWYL